MSDCARLALSESNSRCCASASGSRSVCTVATEAMKKVIAPAIVLFHLPLYFSANMSLPAAASCRICCRSSGELPRLSASCFTESSPATGVNSVAVGEAGRRGAALLPGATLPP